eukprot:8216685-Lingulodinium_polyedra.AAC.1
MEREHIRTKPGANVLLHKYTNGNRQRRKRNVCLKTRWPWSAQSLRRQPDQAQPGVEGRSGRAGRAS